MLNGFEHFYPLFRERILRLAQYPLVLDLGTTLRFRKSLKPFQSLFEDNLNYYALGYHVKLQNGRRSVDVDGDIQNLPFGTSSVNGVICIEVLEHVPNPRKALMEIHRILRPQGALLLIVPFMQCYHGKPGDYGDFWRYTSEGLRYLMRDFTNVDIRPLGGLPYRLLNMLLPSQILTQITSNRALMSLVNVIDKRIDTRSPLEWIVWAER